MARLLKSKSAEQAKSDESQLITNVIKRYGVLLKWVLAHKNLTLLVAAATLAFTILLTLLIPKGFFPVQDTGVIQAITETPASASFSVVSETTSLAC